MMRDDLAQLAERIRDVRNVLASTRATTHNDFNLPMPRACIHQMELELFEAEIRLERARFILASRTTR